MPISIPSPGRLPRYSKQEDDLEYPTNPSGRPLMYTTPPSSNEEEDMEKVPMLLSTFEAGSNEEGPVRRNSPNRRRSLPSFKRFRPFLAVVVLAVLCYIYLANDSMNSSTLDGIESVSKDDEKGNKTIESMVPDSPAGAFSLSSQPTPKHSPTEVVSKNSEEDSSIDQDPSPTVQEAQSKNNLVLHIGPQKTGSTTLQDAWSQFGVLSHSLEMDNYEYRFIHPSSGFFDCNISTYGGYKDCKASTKLKGLIRKTKKADKNLLLSDENLDDRFPEALRDVIDDNDWDVTVIVVYRRIHQWLVSWYDQINKTTNKDSEGNILIDESGRPYRREHTHWPDEGGVPIPSFSTWYKEFTRYWDPSELVSKHRSIAFMNAFKPYFKNIVVHNMHRDGDLMTNFMCDSFPNAPHSCEQLRNRSKRLPRDNQSVNLDYDILAVQARQNGILKTTLSRKEAVAEIEKFVKASGKSIPRMCDNETIDQIKNWLLQSEEAMFPNEWSDKASSHLNDLFDSYVESGKLCDIDFDKVFRDEGWIDFFKTLDNRPTLVLHIGPQKTGSTTLQHVWAAPKELRNVMKEDNFDYYFINPHRGTFECGLEWDTFVDCKVSEKLRQIFQTAREQGKNLLLSDENLDERFAKTLRDAISDNHFRVKIVLVYRRIHRWLPSWYSQVNKSANVDGEGNLLRDENGEPKRQPHTKWPNEGGIHIPGFSEWFRGFVKTFDDTSNMAPNHPSIRFKEAYEPYFDNIEVYDMEQEGDLVTNFMCQMIPEASKTCERLKQGNLKLPLENSSVKVEYDILSVSAYEHGLINRDLSRPDVVSKVQQYAIESGISLPRRCDQEVMSEIHDWLIDSEKVMFPERWSPPASDALEKIYDSYASSGKLCDVDIEKVLSDKTWVDFFASLRR